MRSGIATFCILILSTAHVYAAPARTDSGTLVRDNIASDSIHISAADAIQET